MDVQSVLTGKNVGDLRAVWLVWLVAILTVGTNLRV
jgi:hypothetical protein